MFQGLHLACVAANDSDLAMELINSIVHCCLSEGRTGRGGAFIFWDGFQEVAHRFLEDEQFVPHFKALLRLICRPWFGRLWIVQEFLLASKQTVFYGDKSVAWLELFRIFLF